MENNFNFSAEAHQIGEQIKSLLNSTGDITQQLRLIQKQLENVLQELQMATDNIDKMSKAKQRLKQVSKRMKTNYAEYNNDLFVKSFTDAESREAFLNQYELYKQSNNRIKLTRDDLEQSYSHLDFTVNEAEIKRHLLKAYKIIMEIRAAIKGSYIQYGVFFSGQVNGREEIFMWTPSVEELVEKGFVGSQIDIQLSLTGIQIQEILNEQVMSNTIGGQWQNFLQNQEDRINWELLLRVRQKIIDIRGESKKIYYNFGQLIEALVYLRGKVITTANVYQALIQGANATPFETSGDFMLDDQDIQSKMFSTTGDKDTYNHRIRIMKLSGIKRVLNNIIEALKNSSTPESLKESLEKAFSTKGYNTANWDAKIEGKIKQVAGEEIENFLNEIFTDIKKS